MTTTITGDVASSTERYRRAATILHDVARPMKVLSRLAWPAEERERFLGSGGTVMPEPEYEPLDPTDVLDGVATARRELRPGSIVDDWLEGEARAIEATALMLSTVGTRAFHAYSRQVYGVPTLPLRFDPTTPLTLAREVHQTIDELRAVDLLPPPRRDLTGEDIATQLTPQVQQHFGSDAPAVLVVDELSANALATATKIKVRRDAMFTRRDGAQLLNHEAYIHVGTALNGRAQPDLPILAVGHPGTTRTQEGLAVFSEFVSGTLELDRLRRLADRTVAVQMVCEGADFVELYRWFLDRSPSDQQAFESTRRIFRGSPLDGGAPFTKDCGYLSGLLGVMTFVRAAFAADRADTLGLLFAGKLDLYAVPALAELRAMGLCRPGRYLPPWASDPGWVLTWLTLSTFMSRIDLDTVSGAVGDLLARCPQVQIQPRDEAGPPAP
jgi:uncharacterized protein (TIGR02421 family)